MVSISVEATLRRAHKILFLGSLGSQAGQSHDAEQDVHGCVHAAGGTNVDEEARLTGGVPRGLQKGEVLAGEGVMEMLVLGHCAIYFAMRILTRQERVKLNSLPLVANPARFLSSIGNDFRFALNRKTHVRYTTVESPKSIQLK